MWRSLGKFILKNRFPILFVVIAATVFMGYHAKQVQQSYEFAKAIPTDNPKYKIYQEFKKQFGEDGNLLVIGIQTEKFFTQDIFNSYATMQRNIKKVTGVEDIIGIPTAVNLRKDSASEKLRSENVFPDKSLTQSEIDSLKNIFLNLPFYQGLLYNPATNAWLMGVRINKDLLNSKNRTQTVEEIEKYTNAFGTSNKLEVYVSGLPLVRTKVSDRIAKEMGWFLMMSVILSAVILLLFFRSITSTLLSLSIVIIGVLWSLGTMHLIGYKITLLTALIPPLIVVIGIPNCIYFLNKYHVAWNDHSEKKAALVNMVERMGIVTLFCNLTAAIGFAVFALTKSATLKEFGVVAGINIMALFFISLAVIPIVLSFLPAPKERHTKYLDNPWLNRWLDRLERWSLNHRKFIYAITTVLIVAAAFGILRLKSVGYIVDDLPKSDKIYTDLKFFEKNFTGVMPLEIIVDAKKKRGAIRFDNLSKIDSLSHYLESFPDVARPLSITEGLKFAKQAFFDGDSMSYSMPAEYDLPALSEYLSMKADSTGAKSSFSKLIASFMDSTRQQARISINMADIGSARLPLLLDSIEKRSTELFAKDKYDVKLTGTSVTFLEGTRFIINGLKESVLWAFLLIAICMLYLFKSPRILLCSLIPNLIPLVITAGVMGWAGVAIKPSTVLVFSVALGIAIDVTIRFLINYKQELPQNNFDPKQTVIETIHSTGISIIYTSLVLIAGFIIFCFSGFGGTKALGWLTSLTLITATLTNLVLLPAMLISTARRRK
jgi:predicted RND superfamily exporter protein